MDLWTLVFALSWRALRLIGLTIHEYIAIWIKNIFTPICLPLLVDYYTEHTIIESCSSLDGTKIIMNVFLQRCEDVFDLGDLHYLRLSLLSLNSEVLILCFYGVVSTNCVIGDAWLIELVRMVKWNWILIFSEHMSEVVLLVKTILLSQIMGERIVLSFLLLVSWLRIPCVLQKKSCVLFYRF
jgi:hypothetical protein